MQGGGDVPIVVMTLPLLLSAVSVEFFASGSVTGFMKMGCTIIPCQGSAFGCGWRTFDPEHGRPCTSSW